MVEPNRSEKLVEINPNFELLEAGKSLNQLSVVSVIGRISVGKSTLLNSLLGQNLFHVEEFESSAVRNTTVGIDISTAKNKIYLDCEGAFSKNGNDSNIMKIAAFVSCFSDIVLVFLKKDECDSVNSTYDKFLEPLFLNKLLKKSAKKNIVIVVRDLKKKTLENPDQVSEIKKDISERLESSWQNALDSLKKLDPKFPKRDLSEDYHVHIEFVKFNEDEDNYERLEGIKEILQKAQEFKSEVILERLSESKNYADANVFQDPIKTREEIKQKHDEFRNMLAQNPFDSFSQKNFDEKYLEIKTPVSEIFKKAFEYTILEQLQISSAFKIKCLLVDIKYHYFKFRAVEALFSELEDDYLANEENSLKADIESELNQTNFSDTLKNKIREGIQKKKAPFVEKLKENLKSAQWGIVKGYVFTFSGSLALAPVFYGSKLAALGIEEGVYIDKLDHKTDAFLGAGITYSDVEVLKSTSCQLQTQLEKLGNELTSLVEAMEKSRGLAVIFSIDNQSRELFDPIDLESILSMHQKT